MKILVLALNQFNFTNQETGEKFEGVTIEYLADKVNDDNKKGYFPLKQSLEKEELSNLNAIPGIYEADVCMKSGQNRKATVNFVNFKLVKEYKLEI